MRYMDNQQKQTQSEQQQHNNATNEQQQNKKQQPKLTIRTKGIEITDMKQFLANKKRNLQ